MEKNLNSVNCNQAKAENIVDELLRCLREEHLYQAVQKSIIDAGKTFELPISIIQSHKELIYISGKYLKHISENSEVIYPQWTEIEARKKAVFLLERYYESNGVQGFESALLDAKSDFRNGIHLILEKLTQLLISFTVHDYKNYVFYSLVPPDDHELKESIVNVILVKFANEIPVEISQRCPGLFTTEIPSLIQIVLQCEEDIDRILMNR